MNGQTDTSLTGQIASDLSTPFSSSMSWLQLAAVIIFIVVVATLWRQVVLFIGQEV